MKAVVVGGGISGLTLSLVLSDFYDDVILIDSDLDNIGQAGRRGAPQGAHLHVLLKKGQDVLFNFFPDLLEVVRKDCESIDWAKDTRWRSFLGEFPQYDSDIKTYSFSRTYLEGLLFRKVCANKKITCIKSKITSLIVNDQKSVLGAMSQKQDQLYGDVFLCSGANFPLLKIFKESGLQRYKEDKRLIDITYQSQIIDRELFGGCKQDYNQFFPPYTTSGHVKTPIEKNKMVATQIDYQYRGKPQSEESLSILRKKYTHRRDIKQICGMLILGDALCSLNPVYGQGMTVAFSQIELLKKELEKKREMPRLQKKLLRLSFSPWILSNMGFQVKENLASSYLKNLYAQCLKSRDLHLSFLKVLHMKSTIFSLLDLRIIISTLNLKRRD